MNELESGFLLTELVLLTSSIVSPGSSLMSSDRCVSWLDESSSLVRSVCSHQRSVSPKDKFCWASSGVSLFRRYTLWGTETHVNMVIAQTHTKNKKQTHMHVHLVKGKKYDFQHYPYATITGLLHYQLQHWLVFFVWDTANCAGVRIILQVE